MWPLQWNRNNCRIEMGLFGVVTNWIPCASWDIITYQTSYLIKWGHFITSWYEVWVIENMATASIERYLKMWLIWIYKKSTSKLMNLHCVTKWGDFVRQSPWAPYSCPLLTLWGIYEPMYIILNILIPTQNISLFIYKP